jgi:hypothetical protein
MRDVSEIFAEWRAQREQEAAAQGITLDELEAREEVARLEGVREDERRAKARDRAAWIARWKDHLPESSCAELYDGKSQSTDAIRHVRTWLGTETPCLILCGGVGTGKTYAAMWAARERWGEFVPAQHLPRRVDPWKHEAETSTPLRGRRDPVPPGALRDRERPERVGPPHAHHHEPRDPADPAPVRRPHRRSPQRDGQGGAAQGRVAAQAGGRAVIAPTTWTPRTEPHGLLAHLLFRWRLYAKR